MHGRSGEWSRRASAMQRVGLAAVDRHPGWLHRILHLDEPRHTQDLAVRGQGLAAGDGYPVRNDLWQSAVEVQRLASDLTPCPYGQGVTHASHVSFWPPWAKLARSCSVCL